MDGCRSRYDWARHNPSDIHQLVPILFQYGSGLSHITEFGVRYGVSTAAWQACMPSTLRCYDNEVPDCLPELERIARETKCDFRFIHADTRKVEIEPTELLFVDTMHTYAHLKLEIWRNHERVSKFMLFHDTESAGRVGYLGGPGLLDCLDDFQKSFPEWKMVKHYPQSNGLTVLERLPHGR